MDLFFLSELVQKASKDDSRDFLFYLAVANYRLKVSVLRINVNSFKIAACTFYTHLRVLSLSSALFFPPQDYEKALKYIRILLRNEPGNKQALELEKLIDKALKKGKQRVLNIAAGPG